MQPEKSPQHTNNKPSTEERNNPYISDDLSVLLPEELANLPGIQGTPKILTGIGLQDRTRFVVFDEASMTASEIDSNFQYFGESSWSRILGLPSFKNGKFPRLLLHGAISRASSEILFADLLEVHTAWHGKGIATAFSRKLRQYAQSKGYQFIFGFQNDSPTARYFMNRGRYLLDDIKPELHHEFLPATSQASDSENLFMTIDILDPSQVQKYVIPEHLSLSITERLRIADKRVEVTDLFDRVQGLLDRVYTSDRHEKFQSALLRSVELLDILDSLLPAELVSGLDIGSWSVQDVMMYPILTADQIKAVLEHVTKHKAELLKNLNDDDLSYLQAISRKKA